MGDLLTNPNREMRQFERRPYIKTVDYSVNAPEFKKQKMLNLKGKAIDICDAGIGIHTDYPLAPGYMLRFNDGIEHKAVIGIVMWCIKLDDNYRVGIKLAVERQYINLLDEVIELFNKQLAGIEKRCSAPEADPYKLLNDITIAISDAMDVCEEFERGVKDRDIIQDAQFRFREKTNPILSKSYCINRTRTWPQGFQGDYKTLEGVYKNTPLSDGIGYYLDLYMLNAPLAHAVRNRIKKLEELLRDEILKRERPSILNIGCGSCRELMGLVPEIKESNARVTCIDNDNDALAFAQSRLYYTGIFEQVEFRKYNALRLFDYELAMSDFGKQDIIYSVGLFDYLPSDFLVKMFGTLYNLLNDGGRLIAAFKDARRYRPQEYHWLVDWNGFLQRNEEDFMGIFFDADIPDSAISEMREDTGIIIFYIITK